MNRKIKIYISYGLWGIDNFIKDGVFDATAWLEYNRQLSNAGFELYRHIPFSIWVDLIEKVFSPFQLIGGEFDHSKWRLEYFTTMRQAFALQLSVGITPVLDLCDTNQQTDKDFGKFSPYLVNKQKFHTFYDPAAAKYFKATIERFIFEFYTLPKKTDPKWDVKFGQCNEGGDQIVKLAREIINPALKAAGLIPWSFGACAVVPWKPQTAIDLLKDDAERIFWGKDADKIFRPSHGCGDVKDIRFSEPLRWWKNHCFGAYDDGVKNGLSTCDCGDWRGKHRARPSDKQLHDMVAAGIDGMDLGVFLFEHSPEAGEKIDCQVRAGKAMSLAVFEKTGNWPKNYGKRPDPIKPEPEPEPQPIPEPEPEPIPIPEYPKLKITWQGWLGLGVMLFVLILMAIAIF